MKSPGPFRCNVKVTKKCQHLSVKVKGGRGFSSPYSPSVQNKKALDNDPRLFAVRKGLESSRYARSACCPKPPVKPDGLTSPLGNGGRGFSSPCSPPIQNKKALDNNPRLSAVRKGLEPSTSGVTGRHSNQLNYRTGYSAFSRNADANIEQVFATSKFFL